MVLASSGRWWRKGYESGLSNDRGPISKRSIDFLTSAGSAMESSFSLMIPLRIPSTCVISIMFSLPTFLSEIMLLQISSLAFVEKLRFLYNTID